MFIQRLGLIHLVIGRNFVATNCTGNGDACLSCTGVRDIDYLKRTSGNPHTYTWSNANCGGSVHCVGAGYSEAVWSLWKRKLQAAPYNYDDHTAHEIVTRLTYIGGGNTGVVVCRRATQWGLLCDQRLHEFFWLRMTIMEILPMALPI